MTLAELQQAVAFLFAAAVYGQSYTAAVDASGNATIALWNNALGAQPDATALSTALSGAQLAAAKTAQMETLVSAYSAARYGTPVTVTSGSTTLSFPADQATQMNVSGYLVAYASPNTPPASMPLADVNGVAQSVTYAELQQMAKAIADQSVSAFNQLQTLQAQVAAATTISAVQAVVWP